jgi:hypothetical protein
LLLEVYVPIGWFKTFEIKSKNRRSSILFWAFIQKCHGKTSSLQKNYKLNQQKPPMMNNACIFKAPKVRGDLFDSCMDDSERCFDVTDFARGL